MNKSRESPIINSLEALNKLIALLLKEQGVVGSWTAFGTINEGKTLPGGFESASGMILNEAGKVYYFWFDWDPEKIAPDGSRGWYTLGERDGFFHEITPEAFEKKWGRSLEEDERVQRAKKQLGLA